MERASETHYELNDFSQNSKDVTSKTAQRILAKLKYKILLNQLHNFLDVLVFFWTGFLSKILWSREAFPN